MSSSTPSVAVAAEGEDQVHMSRQNDTATRLGRLKLDSNGSSSSGSGSGSGAAAGDMAVTTRGQARREEHRQVASRAPARQTRGQAGQSRITPATTRRRQQQSRDGTSARALVAEDDSEAETSDEDDDDDDGDDDLEPSAGQPANIAPEMYYQTVVRAVFSIFDSRGLSPPEFNAKAHSELHADTQALRDLADSVARNIRDLSELQQHVNAVPIVGEVWGRKVYETLSQRVTRHIAVFDQGTNAQADAVWLLQEFLNIYKAIITILVEPPYRGMRKVHREGLVSLLCYILDYILTSDHDIRRTQTAQHYAGGGGQHEYNLYMRFSSHSTRWHQFLDLLDALARNEHTRPLFRTETTIGYLRDSYSRQNTRHHDAQHSQSADDLFRSITLIIQNVGIPAA